MLDFINEQSGRIMLVAAIAATAASLWLNRWPEPPPIPDAELNRPVLVALTKETLATANAEEFFSRDPGKENEQAWCDERGLFEKENKVKPFVPVELELPPAGVMRPPQVLPEPGPSLEGSDKLPRYGDEFPPLSATPPAPAVPVAPAAPVAPAPPPAAPPAVPPAPPGPKNPRGPRGGPRGSRDTQ